MQQTKTRMDWPANWRLKWEIDGPNLVGIFRCLIEKLEEEEDGKLQFSRGKWLTVTISLSLSLSTLDWETKRVKSPLSVLSLSKNYRKLKSNVHNYKTIPIIASINGRVREIYNSIFLKMKLRVDYYNKWLLLRN